MDALFYFADLGKIVWFALHLNVVADVPPEYSRYVWDAAQEHNVNPLDLAAVLISEKSGPDMDFSFQGSLKRDYAQKYNPNAEGKAAERGLFQVTPRWAVKAGFASDDLWDPEINARVAAFVVAEAQRRHAKCEKRRYNYHGWIAHYKCSAKDRDTISPYNFCRFKQKKYEKLRISLGQLTSPDFDSIGRAHNKRLRKLKKRAMRDWKRKQRRAAKRQARSQTAVGD